MRTLIINLTRFGDLLQTQPVISDFKSRGDEVALLCLDNFASAAGLLRDVDRVLPLAGARLMALLDRDWRQALTLLHRLVRQAVDEFGADHCVNLTPSLSGRLLARRMDCKEFHGFGIDEFGFNADESSWAAFLQLAAGERGSSPFNVCDLFRRTAGLMTPGRDLQLATPSRAGRAAARALLLQDLQEVPNGFVGLQLGASEDRRRWPVERFRGVARSLWLERGLVPVLLGTEGEKHLAARFSAQADFPALNLMGRTGLSELSGVLSQMDLLLTNDTGTMHLAAGLGVPICSVFLATAQPWDTAPYRSGAICLEPDLPCHPCTFGQQCPNDQACRRSVSAETMAGCAAVLLDGAGSPAADGARIWRTVWSDDGLLSLESLSGHGNEERSTWIVLQRHVYRRFLDGEDVGDVSAPGMSPRMRHELRESLTSASDMLHLLASQATLLSRDPLPPMKRKFLANFQRMQGILESSSLLRVLGLLWHFQSQQHGSDLTSLCALIGRYQSLVAAFLRAV